MDERRSPRAQEPVGHPRKQRRNRTAGAAKGILMTVLTLMLVGVCTVAMLFGIFMKYVNTSLLPTLDVKAEDYTMALSSVVYYQNRDSGEWVEFQKVHGHRVRIRDRWQ